MDIGNIDIALAVYQYANKAQKNNAAEKTSFADMVKQTAGSSSTDRTEAYKPSCSEAVMQAYEETLKETGIDPFPMNRISTALVIQVEQGKEQRSFDFLGNTAESAKAMVKNILERIYNPISPPMHPEFAETERKFYESFLDKLLELSKVSSSDQISSVAGDVEKGAGKMGISNVDSALLTAYQHVNKTQRGSTAEKTSFADTVKQTAGSSSTDRIEQYVEYLKQRYGANVMVKDIGTDQRSIDNFGASMAGINNIVIAPNIMEKMINDPEIASKYEGEIQNYFDSFPAHQAEFSAKGFEIQAETCYIDSRGIVHRIVSADLKPEVKAKIEAKIRAEQAAKRGRREKYQELAAEAADKRRQLAELQYHKQLMSEVFQKSAFGIVNYHFINQPQMSAAAAAYEGAVSTYSGSMFGDI